MKKYIDAQLEVVRINNNNIIVTSPGVQNADTLGNEYNSSDVSYAPGRNFD